MVLIPVAAPVCSARTAPITSPPSEANANPYASPSSAPATAKAARLPWARPSAASVTAASAAPSRNALRLPRRAEIRADSGAASTMHSAIGTSSSPVPVGEAPKPYPLLFGVCANCGTSVAAENMATLITRVAAWVPARARPRSSRGSTSGAAERSSTSRKQAPSSSPPPNSPSVAADVHPHTRP